MLKITELVLKRRKFTYSFTASAQAGEVVLIRGASGIGKSTLLDCLAGFEIPDQGKASWLGADFLSLAPHARPLSLLQQGNNLFPHLNLLDNVALASQPKWFISREAKQKAPEVLAQVGLAEHTEQMPEQVSGGQAQRAGLARALLRHDYSPRPLLMLDEPYSALDENNASDMHKLVQHITKEHHLCVLLVAHREMSHDRQWQLVRDNEVVSIVE